MHRKMRLTASTFKISFPVLRDVPGAAEILRQSLVLGHLDDEPKANPALDCCKPAINKDGYKQKHPFHGLKMEFNPTVQYTTGPFWRQEHLASG